MDPLVLDGKRLRGLHDRMLASYGEQHWWPADTRFEVMVGAVLTQNTAWGNVERTIANLREAGRLELESMLACPAEELAQLIRSSGYFNLKASRLHNLCRFVKESGGETALESWSDGELREGLLGISGVGPETADDILLYAYQRPCFVIDAYTRRLFSRQGLILGNEPYESLRLGVEQALGRDVPLYNEYHGLIVAHAKCACRKRPACGDCCVREGCLQAEGERPC